MAMPRLVVVTRCRTLPPGSLKPDRFPAHRHCRGTEGKGQDHEEGFHDTAPMAHPTPAPRGR